MICFWYSEMRCILTHQLPYITKRLVVFFFLLNGNRLFHLELLCFINIMHMLMREDLSLPLVLIYQARAMQGLAEEVLHTLRTDPDKLQSEFSITRGRPGKKSSRARQARVSRKRAPRPTGVRIGASSLGNSHIPLLIRSFNRIKLNYVVRFNSC